MLFGGLEAGGTKMVCAITNEKGEIIDRVQFDTVSPDITMPKMIDYFKQYDISALGISCFGPIDLNKKHDTYGYILKTPKVKWDNYNIVKAFKDALNVPVGFDTDVNGACLAETIYGAGKGLDNVAYFTIGTGIGVGLFLNGQLHHGLLHPETGHMFINKHPNDSYEGCCVFHKNCFEGLASGPAIEKRYHKKGEELDGNKEFIELEAYYIAQGVCNAIYAYSPEIVILGGGVMHNTGLIEAVREKVVVMLNGYIQSKEICEHINDYIVLPGLKDNAGVLGSIELAKLEYSSINNETI